MDNNEGTSTEDLWTPYKELVAVVESYLATEGAGAPYAVHTFESVLRRHKQTFLSLMKNPVKNSQSREEIKRGITEGVTLPSVGRTLLSKELVDEAIIISDMYNVNEYLALELLHTAQRQSPRHPGLPRGLVAILLYYDGRRALVQALRELMTARSGISWTVNAREEIVKYVSRYMDQLISDGLLSSILETLKRFTLAGEQELLQNNRALPPRRYHTRLVATIENTRKLLAGVIFTASAQRGLFREILLRIIDEQSSAPPQTPTGTLDEVSLALQMALLYGLDLSVIHRRDDGEEMAKRLPILRDPNLLSILVDKLSPPTESNQTQNTEKSGGVRALCQLSLGLALAALKRAPQSLLRRGDPDEYKAELLDQDEVLVDAAIDGKVFEYLDEAILSTEYVSKEEYYQKRIHSLITDFIVLMHSKLMEMRAKADEAAREVQMYAAEGLNPPAGTGQSRTRLDALLRCVEKLYACDPHGLRYDYWLACETHTNPHSNRTGSRAATLYKFVRLSGELVCASLLPAYLRALASLAVPKHTWALLARRDALSAHHLLTALLRYHRNLRADPTPFSDHLHSSSLGASAIVTPAARPGKLLMRQEEVEAMVAALRLIATVAKQDQAACTAICENLQWDAVDCMFGLICCHIPIHLKAELCLTLAALGGRPTTAGRVWAALEASRLVLDKRALYAELHEVECRMEDYPLSVAFLTLLDSLCEAAPVPRALGAGSRPPGLSPYLEYVLTRLALPAPHRSYVRPQRQWQVLELSFRLFARWLDQYEPSPSDIPPAGREPETNPPPGFTLLLQLHTESELLRLLVDTMYRATDILDSHPLPGKEFVEESLILVLRILERGLALERALLNAAAEASRSLIIVGLTKLLIAPEASESQDRLVTVCKVLQHGTTLPAASARALPLLSRALESPAVARHLLARVATSVTYRHEIRHGFVECLECEEWIEGEAGEAMRQTKEGIVSLLLQILPTAAPNLAHWLLGYQITGDVSRSQLNEAGAAGFPRTCLHSILDILDNHIATNNPEREASDLVESCYRLVYWLCARANTSGPMLRYLRARDYFLARHVRYTVNLETASVVTVSSRSWVLRASACEAGAACTVRHHGALSALLSALTRPTPRSAQEWESCLIRRMIESLPVTVDAVHEPRWELFHAHQLRHLIAECELPVSTGGKRISVSRVHAVLERELANLNASAPQKHLVVQEIHKVLDYVTEVNKQRNLAATLTHYYDSWRQLTEILFCVAPQDLLPRDAKKTLLLNILQDLLNKIPPAEVLPQLGNIASGTILLLLVNLRHCYILEKRELNLSTKEFETSFFGPSNQIMQTKSLTLKFILHKILSWILVAGGSTQKMRVNLYGSLLNFLNLVNLKISPADPEEEGSDATYVSRLDNSKARVNKEDSSLKAMVIEVIMSFGDNLCSVVSSDCIGGGHDVCRMVALSCLDTLIEIHPRSEWMSMLTNQGYLRSLIDSLLQEDDGLKEALESNPKSLRVLYVYESKMALLIKIAGTRLGAETVLAQGALSSLANMKALDCHPDIYTGYGTSKDTEFVPSVANRFRQMLIPALALCDALLTALGTHNHSCIIHVTHFLLSHLECVDMVLRAAHSNSPEGLLIELEAITSVISRASNPEVFGLVQDDTALQHSATSLQRVQRLMLALIPRFKLQLPAAEQEDSTLYYKIVCNLLSYARNISGDGGVLAVLRGGASDAEGVNAELPGVVLELLQRAAAVLLHHRKRLAAALQQQHSCSREDMKHLLSEEESRRFDTEGQGGGGAAAVATRLAMRVRTIRRELRLCMHALESALHLLWLHTQMRLHHHTHELTYHQGISKSEVVRRLNVGEQMPELKKLLVQAFNDRFTEQLLDIAKSQPPAQRGFIEVLLKDIKRMIQFAPT